MILLLERAGVGVAVWVAVAVLHPAWTSIGLSVLAVYLGSLLLATLVGRINAELPQAGPSAIQLALADRPREPEAVVDLERMERIVNLGVSRAGDAYGRLRPVLAEIAEPLLAARGVDLESDPERARELLGEDAWELLRPDQPRPEDRFAPGASEARLRATVDVLERMAG